MLQCPKAMHRIHKFKHDGKLYVADLEECQVLEIDGLIWEILDLCAFHTTEEIIEAIGETYDESEILDGLRLLSEIEQEGLFFHKGQGPPNEKKNRGRLKLFVPEAERNFLGDIGGIAGGAVVAVHYILNALTKYADVYVLCDEDTMHSDAIYGERLGFDEIASFPSKFIQRQYDGIFTWHFMEPRLLSLFHSLEVPIVTRIYSPRGHGGELVNAILRLYATMRAFDALIVPTASVKQFYSRFVMDNDCFFVVPNGVDTKQFYPMNKRLAKKTVAEMLGRPEITRRPVIGFLSRFQPEKGAGVYLQVAEMNPDWLFLTVVPRLGPYGLRELPPNFIYAGPQPREHLPIFFNAFDVHCFPSMIGEESFGNAVLEAMACGTPPVVPKLASLPEVVADAGVLVEAQPYDDEIGSFAGYVSPKALSEAIGALIQDEEAKLRLGEKARQRALTFTWDKTAQRICGLFKRLNGIRQRQRKAYFSTAFTPYLNTDKGQFACKSLCLNVNSLNSPTSYQTVEEGIALSLQRRHSWHQIETLLRHITGSDQRAWKIQEQAKEIIESANSQGEWVHL